MKRFLPLLLAGTILAGYPAVAQNAAPTRSQRRPHHNGSRVLGCRFRVRGFFSPVIKFDIVLQHVHGVSGTLLRGGDDFQIFEIRLAIG